LFCFVCFVCFDLARAAGASLRFVPHRLALHARAQPARAGVLRSSGIPPHENRASRDGSLTFSSRS
jgi:hypothetical protein